MEVLLLLLLLPLLNFAEEIQSRIRNEVCYEDLGCFERYGEFIHPQHRPISFLPQSPQKIDDKFILFTRQNKMVGQVLEHNNADGVSRSNFNARRQTKVIVFGFVESPSQEWVSELKDAFLNQGDYNVIAHDWSSGNGFPYTQAVANTRVSGAVIARFLTWLQTEFGLSPSRVHILGHSLGSHISGYAGQRMSPKLARISGLDPAGPYFEFMDPVVRLDHTDAEFVDVIHTDGNYSAVVPPAGVGWGLMQPSGHVDFYPNGGRSQPGCETVLPITFCHHQRSHVFMIASVKQPELKFSSVPCDSYAKFLDGSCSCGSIRCASMGLNADKWKPRGRDGVKMFLRTTSEYPYDSA